MINSLLRKFFNAEWPVITGAYLLAYGLLLLNTQGLYWDDWGIYGQTASSISKVFGESGLPWMANYHLFMATLGNGVYAYHLLVFGAFLIAALLLLNILRTIREIDPADRMLVALFFAVFPVNTARTALINSPYAICYMFFFIGFWLLAKYLTGKRIILLRLLALGCFFWSFWTNSILLFLIIPLCYINYVEKDRLKNLKSIFTVNLRYLDFWLLPIIFVISKMLFFTPTGRLAHYNAVTLPKFIKGIVLALIPFGSSFCGVITDSLDSIGINSLYTTYFILLTIAIYLPLRRSSVINKENRQMINLLLLGAGIFFFYVAVFPYTAVGKTPHSSNWAGRHQLLTPLGAALMLVFGTRTICRELGLNRKIANASLSILLGACILQCFNIQLSFHRDWLKQVALIENFKSNPIIRDNSTFLFEDNTMDYNANLRDYTLNEFSSLFKVTFGDESRFGIMEFEYKNMDAHMARIADRSNLDDYIQLTLNTG